MIKQANTQYPVKEVIRDRWSARSFSDRPIKKEEIATIFEAASWAPSSHNEQPWQYYYAHRGAAGFEKLLNCLTGGNRTWAKNAAVIIVSVARKTFELNGEVNYYTWHDIGMANAHLFLQATSMQIFGHPMGGFDRQETTRILQLTDNQEVVCMIVLGYLDIPEKLNEPFKTREITPRKRKMLEEFVRNVG
ncbi:MAG: nitroreductase family protein [Crocinitomicaceae bacterium]|nr:nitroreductase family protein [Crocinitomicaceae bacterium]